MLVLGIETSCDETAISLLEVKSGQIKILSSIISSQVKLHSRYGGVVPSLAAREHVKNLAPVLKMALRQLSTINHQLSTKNVDLIAVTRGPGLVSSLLVGITFAQTLAWKYNKPIVVVNHLEGHIASNWLRTIEINSKFEIRNSKKSKTDSKLVSDLVLRASDLFPAMCLIVSGGHTELVLMTGIGRYKLIGQTLDDAAGEAFDKIARILGLGYPGGPAISREVERLQVTGYRLQEKLPRPMIKSRDFNFSFAGLKTAVLYLVRDLTKTNPLPKIKTAIAHEAQQAIVDVLVAKTIRAAQKYKVKSIMLSGGVSANKLLRSELEKASKEKGLKFFRPEMEYTTDNATMIALAGYWNLTTRKKTKPSWQNVRVDVNLTI